MNLIVDSREQRPYDFQGHDVQVEGLPVGDYSVSGGEGLVAVERKSLDDLIGSLTSGRARFERELYKMRALDYRALVIEATLSDIVNGRYRSQMNSKAVVQTLVAFSIRYDLPVWFCGDRVAGRMITESLLAKYVTELQRRAKVGL
jgi:DNA excision repair protein ERCC-4